MFLHLINISETKQNFKLHSTLLCKLLVTMKTLELYVYKLKQYCINFLFLKVITVIWIGIF